MVARTGWCPGRGAWLTLAVALACAVGCADVFGFEEGEPELAQCGTDSDCAPGSVCALGQCTRPCEAGGACPDDSTCLNTDFGPRCVQNWRNTCDGDHMCPPGTTCLDQACRALCTGDHECPGDQACRSGVCVAPHDPYDPSDGGPPDGPGDCNDGLRNGEETDTDCGGNTGCPRCGEGQSCNEGADCQSNNCSGGTCQEGGCPPGWDDCDGQPANGCETDTQTSRDHCGMCNRQCLDTDFCSNGSCISCPGGWSLCGGGCEDISTSNQHCGQCDNPCPSGTCQNGQCQPGTESCSDGVQNQDESDVDCGGSTGCPPCGQGQSCRDGMDCQSGNCSGGTCQGSCPQGYADCDGIPSNGCETNLQTDANACGTCTNACSAGQYCMAGTCGSCPAGWIVCGSSCVDINTSNDHCGGCGWRCSPGVCQNGQCQATGGDCSDMVQNGDESDVDCGGICGPTCANGQSCNDATDCQSGNCVGGTCQGGSCPAGWGDCDGVPSNGCETDTQSSRDHCGQCNNPCPAQLPCINSSCQCQSGFAQCGNLCVNLQTDMNNCGSCGYACSGGQTCVSGQCQTGVLGTVEYGQSASLDACGQGDNTFSFTLSWGSGENRILIVGAAYQGAGVPLAEVRFDGVRMHDLHMEVPANGKVSLYYLLDAELPSAPGTYTVNAIGRAELSDCVIDASVFRGVNQARPPTEATSGAQDSLTPSIAIPVSGSVVYEFFGCIMSNPIADGGQMIIHQGTNGSISGVAAYKDCGTENPCETSWRAPGTDSLAWVAAVLAPAGSGPSCNDGIQNQDETDTDCGGSCGATCGTGQSCMVGTDCQSGNCSSGACEGGCLSGWEDCDGNTANGCETNTQTSDQHCGQCNNPCTNGQMCVAGNCECPVGETMCSDGCVDLQSGTLHCGVCENPCGFPYARTACTSGACQFLGCDAGYQDCYNGLADGCETYVVADINNCATCGNVCSTNNADAFCDGVSCSIQCHGGWDSCDSDWSNGCETDLMGSADDCGQCGRACDTTNVGTRVCSAGVCVSLCTPGWGNCNQPPAPAADDGCETPLGTDTDCGSCGDDCGALSCVDFACTASATCSDFIQNQNETDIDCGGPTPCPRCPPGDQCTAASDCDSGVCTADICEAPTCSDSVQNGNETDTDCGGSCPPCDDGMSCGAGTDCVSGVCSAGICQPVGGVEYGQSATFSGCNPGSNTFPHTLDWGSGNNRMVLAGTVVVGSANIFDVVRYDGVSMSPIVSAPVPGGQGEVVLWLLRDSELPGSAGTYTVEAVAPAVISACIIDVSAFRNVVQTQPPTETRGGASGSDAFGFWGPTPYSWVYDFISATDGSLVLDGPQTVTTSTSDGSVNGAASHRSCSTSDPCVMSWTASGTSGYGWVMALLEPG